MYKVEVYNARGIPVSRWYGKYVRIGFMINKANEYIAEQASLGINGLFLTVGEVTS